MEQIVYADVLLVVNFIINYMLLLTSGLLSGRRIKRKKLIFAALVGAFSAFVIFLPPMGFWLMSAYKLSIAVFMVVLSFPFISPQVLLRDIFIFFTGSYLLAGVCVAVWLNTPLSGFMCYNGVTYFSVNLVSLLISVSLAYMCILVYERLHSAKTPDDSVAEVHMRLFGREFKIRALIDTGNHLTEPFSGSPAVVVGVCDVQQCLPMEAVQAVLGGGGAAEVWCLDNTDARLIPYSTVAGGGALLAFRPESFYMCYKTQSFTVENIYVAISPDKIGTGSYKMVVGDNLIKIPITRE